MSYQEAADSWALFFFCLIIMMLLYLKALSFEIVMVTKSKDSYYIYTILLLKVNNF